MMVFPSSLTTDGGGSVLSSPSTELVRDVMLLTVILIVCLSLQSEALFGTPVSFKAKIILTKMICVDLHLQQGLSVWSLQANSMSGYFLYSLFWTKSSLHSAREVSQQIQFLL